MALLYLLPPVAGLALAALLWVAGEYQVPGAPVLTLEWLAIVALSVTVLALCATSLAVTRKLRRKFVESSLDTAMFERSVARRLAALELLPIAEPAQLAPRSALPAPERPSETPRAPQPSVQPSPVPDARTGAGTSESGNVVQLDLTRASQDKRTRQPLRDIEKALGEGVRDAWYEPVVSMPDRKMRYLVALPYLLREGEAPLAPEHWLAAAVKLGHGPAIDRFMLLDAIKLWRDLNRSQKDCGIIWRPSRPTLSDKAAWGQLVEVMKANRAVGKTFICEVPMAEYATLSHAELDALFAVREAGFRIGLADCTEARTLAEALRTGVIGMVSADVAMFAEPSGIMAVRSGEDGIEFIATGVASEDQAIALIDRDIRLAQGPLFAPAKPLRRDAGKAIAPEGAA